MANYGEALGSLPRFLGGIVAAAYEMHVDILGFQSLPWSIRSWR